MSWHKCRQSFWATAETSGGPEEHKRLSSFCILRNANGELATTPEQKCFILDSFFEHLFTERQRPRLPGYIMLIWPRT